MSTRGTGSNDEFNANDPANNYNNPDNTNNDATSPYGGYGNYPGTGQDGAGYGNYGSSEPGYGAYSQDQTGANYNAYGSPAGAPVVQESNTMAIAALIVSIIALFGSVFFFGGLLGVVGVILAIIAINKSGKIVGPGSRRGMSITALVLSILSIIIPIVLFFIGLSIVGSTGVMDCANLQDQAAIESCVEDALTQNQN